MLPIFSWFAVPMSILSLLYVAVNVILANCTRQQGYQWDTVYHTVDGCD